MIRKMEEQSVMVRIELEMDDRKKRFWFKRARGILDISLVPSSPQCSEQNLQEDLP
jgi:hypothetical protein